MTAKLTISQGLADTALLDGLAEELRAAVRSEDYERTLILLPEYGKLLAKVVPTLSTSPEERERVLRNAGSLLQWAKTVALTGRAHDQAKLGRAEHAAGYLRVANPPRQGWHYEA